MLFFASSEDYEIKAMRKLYSPLLSVLYVVVLLSFSIQGVAQPGCPAVSAGNPVQLPCGTNCTTLTATPFQVGSTTSYGVSAIPYTPFSFNAGTSVPLGQDDYWGSVINLPFNFCFFGHVYNQAVVGANGIVTFNTYRATQYNPWSLTAVNPIPDSSPIDSAFTNCIMCPYQDIDPALGGAVYYQIIGTAPCRILVVSYYQVPMFNLSDCPNNNCTCQMAIYETTNAIEIYIHAKQACSAWNGGLSIEGIMDSTGSSAFTVPGRNLSVWSATDDAWRFTPNGPSIVNVSWYKGNTQISTDSTVQVCPSQATTYTAKAVYTPCAGGTAVTVVDSVTVSLTGSLHAGIDSFSMPTCYGLSNGKAYAHVNGGTQPVSYGWSTGSTATTITNLAAGTYVFTAADAGACVRIDTVHIGQPSPVGVLATLTNPACHSGCNGLIATIDTGGTGGPYNFNWSTSPVQTSQTAMGLCAGTYSVTATDANGCVGHSTFTLTDPAAMFIYLVQKTNVSCRGENNGSVTVAAGGTFNGNVSFHWSNGEDNAADTLLVAGTYRVTATDTAGCTATASYTITQPATGISLAAPTIVNDRCYGNTNGSIASHASGGVAPLTYSWTEVSNQAHLSGASINGLAPDSFDLTVTDANGCYVTADYVVSAAPRIVTDSIRHSGSLCGNANAYAEVFISGGTGAYSYSWSGHPGVNSSTLNNLSGGTYTVTITDAMNCSIQDTVIVPQFSAVIITETSQSNVTCNGGNEGSISIAVAGGVPPYVIAWSNGAQDSLQLNNLAAGTYTVTVSDSSGCVSAKSYQVIQPAALVLNSPTIQFAGCVAGATGTITANPAGGTQAYTYSWVEQSNAQTYGTQTINNLGPDTYNLTVTDAHGCSTTGSYTLTAVVPLTYTIDSSNVSCYGGNNGSVTVNVTSGTAPYQYYFDNTLSATSVYSNLPYGLVDVIVKDANNCRVETLVNIQEPTQIVIHLLNQVNELCFGGNNGSLLVNASGGTPGYTYVWNNYALGTADSNLTAGSYTVTVSDTVLCTVSQTYTITQPATGVTTNPLVQNVLCNSAADGSIDARPSGGTSPYNFVWSNTTTQQVAANLVIGTYTVTVADANGCSASGSGTITQPSAAVVLLDSATPVKCVSQHNGTIIIDVAGGTPPYVYNATRDNANFIYSTNGVILGLDTGVYTVTYSDSFGCTNQISIYVPAAILDSFSTSVDSTLCYGPNYNDGSATVIALPPNSVLNGPYKYGIDNGAQSSDTGYFQNLSAGPHVITAINAKGCVDSIPVFVPEPLPIIVAITPDSITLPLGGSQSVLVTYLNATNPSYNWTPSIGMSCTDCPNPVVSAYSSGTYVITVSMVNQTATCYGTAILNVNVQGHRQAYTPNAFTPNGDGNNDVFQIYGEDIKTVSLKIFNRWGEKVYETNNSLAGWDGTYKGAPQSTGVYTYEAIITYLNDTQQSKNGTITLIR